MLFLSNPVRFYMPIIIFCESKFRYSPGDWELQKIWYISNSAGLGLPESNTNFTLRSAFLFKKKWVFIFKYLRKKAFDQKLNFISMMHFDSDNLCKNVK